MSLEDEKDDSSYMCVVNLSQLSMNCKSVCFFFFNPKCIERVSVFKKKQKEKQKQTKNNGNKTKVNVGF